MNTNLYGSPFAGFTTYLFPVMGNTYSSEEEVAHLATLFPSTIYFFTGE